MDGPRQKLRRANIHFQNLKRALERFKDSEPYDIGHKVITENDGAYGVVYIQDYTPIPDSIPLIVGDICNNLHSALDHTLWRLWLNVDAAFDEFVYFPICDTAARFSKSGTQQLERCIKRTRNIKRLPPNQRTLIERMQPYNRGNDLLPVLQELNRTDKHRLIPMVSAIVNPRRMVVRPNEPAILPPGGSLEMNVPSITRIEDGAELLRVPLDQFGGEGQVDTRFEFDIHFIFSDTPPIADGRGISTTMRAVRDEVEYVISQFNDYL